MTQFLNVDGQKIAYNSESKIIKTTIDEPFMKAGSILGWQKKGPGLGINEKIIEFVLKTRSTLIVHVTSAGRDYFMKNDQIRQDLKTLNTKYKAGGKKWVHVLPWRDSVRLLQHG